MFVSFLWHHALLLPRLLKFTREAVIPLLESAKIGLTAGYIS